MRALQHEPQYSVIRWQDGLSTLQVYLLQLCLVLILAVVHTPIVRAKMVETNVCRGHEAAKAGTTDARCRCETL